MVGIRPLGLRARYAGVSTTPKAMPASMRSNGRSSSAQHHSTFWTLIEFLRPQILSMLHLSPAWCTDRLAGVEELSGVGERPLSCPWMPIVPFKLNQDRRHHIPRQQRRVTNWPAYDA